MKKVKIWCVIVKLIGADRPTHMYFCDRDEAYIYYHKATYASAPYYCGAFNPEHVAPLPETNPANVPDGTKLLYWRTYAEYRNYMEYPIY